MNRTLATLLLVALTSVPAFSQGAMYRVDLDTRIDAATRIVEGRVLDHEAFWNAQGTMIMTAHTVEVSRVFKGRSVEEVIVITPGGTIGHTAVAVEPALRLSRGAVGVFYLEEAPNQPGRWRPFAGKQGFSRYDELRGSAHDVFDAYADIEVDLHAPIQQALGRPVELVHEYDVPKVRKGGSSSQVPVITGFSPTTITAGTLSELTISGSGFELPGSNSLVGFRSADDGGATFAVAPAANIVSWTDTQIRVLVPSGAGTGNILVQATSGQQGTSAGSLTVPYAQTALTGPLEPDLRDRDGSGGYTFSLSTNTASGGVNFASSPAAVAFGRALSTWQTGTGLNMQIGGSTSSLNTVDPHDDTDLVTFDNDSNPLPTGTLGRATSGYASCNGTNWWVSGVDLRFRRDGTDGVTWNFSSGSPAFSQFDFESVAVHELGHAHQLGHVIDATSVMHFVLTNGESLRSLNPPAEIAGGNYVLDHSVLLNACGQTGMQPLVATTVEGPTVPARFVISEAFPNPFADSFRLEMDHTVRVEITVFDILGRSRIRTVGQGALEIDGGHLPAGVYVVAIWGDGVLATRKLVKTP